MVKDVRAYHEMCGSLVLGGEEIIEILRGKEGSVVESIRSHISTSTTAKRSFLGKQERDTPNSNRSIRSIPHIAISSTLVRSTADISAGRIHIRRISWETVHNRRGWNGGNEAIRDRCVEGSGPRIRCERRVVIIRRIGRYPFCVDLVRHLWIGRRIWRRVPSEPTGGKDPSRLKSECTGCEEG